jgi:large subunit ribosomal protein L13
MKQTFTPSKKYIRTRWYLFDAEDKTLGRLASEVTAFLRGKKKVYFTPFLDTGDYIVIINADKIKVTGNKIFQKEYKNHSGTPGGMKIKPFFLLKNLLPAYIIEKAIRGMLPKNALGRKIFRKVYVYATANHPHEGQYPEKIN